jgi:hypothetical protein
VEITDWMPCMAGATAAVHSDLAPAPTAFSPPTKNPKISFAPAQSRRSPASTRSTTGAIAASYSHIAPAPTALKPPTMYPKATFSPDHRSTAPAAIQSKAGLIACVHSQGKM